MIAVDSQKRAAADLDELNALALSAGLEPATRVRCRRDRPDPAFFIGSGKADELAKLIESEAITEVVFDQALSAVHQRNLNRLWQVPVLDRTELKVELARLQHQSTRLVRMWTHLERQRGGIGVRGGPGERQIELDRRMIETKIRRLRERLTLMAKQRQTRRKARQRQGAFKISLVGYTNAGKSTLFNALAGSNSPAYAADQLFATLDTLTRRVHLAHGMDCVLSDTVGFVRDLPHGLVDAFHATLEETAQADLLLHVLDGSSQERELQAQEVFKVLHEIGAGDIPRIDILNKCDLLNLSPSVHKDPYGRIQKIHISAQERSGIELVRQAAVQYAQSQMHPEALEYQTSVHCSLTDFSTN
ncbi:MAG: GTPase HflX [Betaproteobacteria bacterium]|nr:GTPase HflX [Betaproteobacteria bacterium]